MQGGETGSKVADDASLLLTMAAPGQIRPKATTLGAFRGAHSQSNYAGHERQLANQRTLDCGRGFGLWISAAVWPVGTD